MGNPLKKLWRDRCTIFVRQKVKDPTTKLTNFIEVPVINEEPCKLSIESVSAASGGHVATVSQSVKLFLAPELEIPAGSKIVVTRQAPVPREFTYAQSGTPGLFTNHQEIALVPWRGYA